MRQGSYSPGFLAARKISEKALVAVIQESWIGGVSTRRVDDLVQAMGLNGISKSTVSKLCKDIDERVGEFRNPLRQLATFVPIQKRLKTHRSNLLQHLRTSHPEALPGPSENRTDRELVTGCQIALGN